jgi:hypothetical protein
MIWKIILWIPHLLFWVAFAWIIFGIVGIGRVGNRRPARVLDEGRIIFAPHWLTIWAWLLFIGCMAWSVPILSKQSQNSPLMQRWNIPWNFVFLVCLGLSAVGIFYDLPASIVVSEDGLEQLYWFRRRKHIHWKDIVEIESGQKDRMVTITGADGPKIIHTGFLADRPRLLLEIKQHCGENLPPDFPREPIDGL